MKSFGIFSAAVLMISSLTLYAGPAVRGPLAPPRAITGEEVLPAPSGGDNVTPVLSLDEPIGETYAAGTTWYDLQHNGTAGKMIGVDEEGYVHFVWTKGLDAQSTVRHVYYNAWDPFTDEMMLPPDGVQIDVATRGGFTAQAVTADGFACPAFHQIIAGAIAHSAGAMDFLPRTGAFTAQEPDYLMENGTALQLIWPKIALSDDSVAHIVSIEQPAAPPTPIPYRVYYSRGLPDPELGVDWQDIAGGEQFLQVGTAGNVSPDIAASPVSQRVVVAWTGFRPGSNPDAYDLDILYRLSEDGGLNWSDELNLTQFTDEDTQRVYADVSVLFDHDDVLHIAFTTQHFEPATHIASLQTGRLWHWDEAHDSITALGDNWVEGGGLPGAWHLNACRPSLCEDPTTGYVYCSYEWHDLNQISPSGYSNGDVWVTVSADSGLTWGMGRNVTDTPQGAQSQSERDITLAERVTYAEGEGYLNLEWVLDLDAGSSPQFEGTTTLNTVFFQRIPVDSIPLTPLMPSYQFHVGPPPPPDTGRCCYGDPTDPQCAWLIFTACMALDGDWDATLTCDTPCPIAAIGRCCYGDSAQPDCGMMIRVACLALQGAWDSTLTCDTPCPAFVNCTIQDDPNVHCNLDSVAIPDGDFNGMDYVINVPVRYHITDVNLGLDISHPQLTDLEMTLHAPGGTTITLISEQVVGANFRCTVFDDEAPTWIWDGTPPYNGHFKPEMPLNAFDGQMAQGDWTLHVIDTVQFESGMLNWACLSFSYDYIDAASDAPLPVEYSFSAYPNPFNPATTLSFSVAAPGEVRLQLFNLEGQHVRTLVDGRYEMGTYQVPLDARDLPSGVYFSRFSAGTFVKTEKLVLMK